MDIYWGSCRGSVVWTPPPPKKEKKWYSGKDLNDVRCILCKELEKVLSEVEYQELTCRWNMIRGRVSGNETEVALPAMPKPGLLSHSGFYCKCYGKPFSCFKNNGDVISFTFKKIWEHLGGSVKQLTSAQVMISLFVSLNPMPCIRCPTLKVESAWDPLFLSFSAPPLLMCALSLSLSLSIKKILFQVFKKEMNEGWHSDTIKRLFLVVSKKWRWLGLTRGIGSGSSRIWHMFWRNCSKVWIVDWLGGWKEKKESRMICCWVCIYICICTCICCCLCKCTCGEVECASDL